MKKKIWLAILASAMMVLTMIPAVAFAADGSVTVKSGESSKTYETLSAAVREAQSGDTITITGNCTDTDSITIVNKSLTFVGEGASKPEIKNVFNIAHTDGGPYTVSFENIKFAPTTAGNVIAEASTNATSAENVNQLIVKNCEFYLTVNSSSPQGAAVAIKGSGTDGKYVTGAKLTFTGNNVETDSYSGEGSGYYTAGISTSAAGNSLYGNNVYSYAKHEISNNEFFGHLYYAYVGGYANFTDNTIDLKYGSNVGIDDFGRALQVRGAHADNNGGQLDLTVTGNTIRNVKQVFKLYQLDTLVGVDGCTFEIAGSTGSGANTFEGTKEGTIPSLGESDPSASAFGNVLYMENLSNKTWNNITNPELGFKLSQIILTKSGDLSMGKMTVEDGTQVDTYTQIVAPESGRTGLYTEAENQKYWYFATIYPGTVHYFIDDDGNVYMAKLVGGGDAESLDVSKKETSWPGFEKASEGDLYKADFSIATDELSNTYYNATASEVADSTITITAAGGADATDINAFISNIGNYTSLYVTENAIATAPEGALKMVVPADGIGQLLVSGAFPVVIDADISNIEIVNKCDVKINEGSKIGKLEVSEEAAVGTTLKNNGTVEEVYLLATTKLTNNSEITKISVGETRPGGYIARLQKSALACDSVINNEGSIGEVLLASRTDLNNGSENNKNATIQRLVIGNVAMEDENGVPYATDSNIINYGEMCTEDSTAEIASNIEIYVKSFFDNKGTIGSDGRDPATYSCECSNLGGVIYIGYNSASYDSIDGMTFVNEGTIYTGSRHNGDTHQCFSFFILPNPSTEEVNIEIYNKGDGKAYGPAYIGDGWDLEADKITHTITYMGSKYNDKESLNYNLITTAEIRKANYSGLEDVIANVPADLSEYTAESVAALEAVLAEIEKNQNLDFTEQSKVDAMAKALEEAIAGLTPIEEEPSDTPTTPGSGEGTTNGSQDGQVDKVSETGDDTNLALLFGIMALAAAGAGGAAVYSRRRHS